MEKKLVTQTELNCLIVDILGGHLPPSLHHIYTIPHSSGMTNYDYHLNRINSLVENATRKVRSYL